MHTYQASHHVIRRQSFLLLVPFALVLAFFLAACGTNSGTSTGAGTNPTTGAGTAPAPAPTTVKGYGTAYGCPSDAVVNTPPGKANVIVHLTDSKSTITAQHGNVIEFDLPFGQKWSGPTTSQGMLQLQNPAGYAWKTSHMCVWRFVAQGTGTTQVSFAGRAICKQGQLCPQYIVEVPFTIDVK